MVFLYNYSVDREIQEHLSVGFSTSAFQTMFIAFKFFVWSGQRVIWPVKVPIFDSSYWSQGRSESYGRMIYLERDISQNDTTWVLIFKIIFYYFHGRTNVFLEGKNISVEGCLWPDVAQSSILISNEHQYPVCLCRCVYTRCVYVYMILVFQNELVQTKKGPSVATCSLPFCEIIVKDTMCQTCRIWSHQFHAFYRQTVPFLLWKEVCRKPGEV